MGIQEEIGIKKRRYTNKLAKKKTPRVITNKIGTTPYFSRLKRNFGDLGTRPNGAMERVQKRIKTGRPSPRKGSWARKGGSRSNPKKREGGKTQYNSLLYVATEKRARNNPCKAKQALKKEKSSKDRGDGGPLNKGGLTASRALSQTTEKQRTSVVRSRVPETTGSRPGGLATFVENGMESIMGRGLRDYGGLEK